MDWLNGKIIGTGASIPWTDKIAEIKHIDVLIEMRHQGMGGKILAYLCEYALSHGFKRIIFGTTRSWIEVIAFYKKYGFNITHYQEQDVYFALDL